ncbi:MAG: hypothetical protein EXR75_14200 [Myxococcales bacterium]|nr:hypothetical protein [Myxococcales bacterium]
MQVARMVLAMFLGIAMPLLVQWLDARRMSAERRARAWNTASWGAALYAFGPASMLGWMWVTRPRGARIAYGAIATAALVLGIEFADRALLVLADRAPEGEAHELVFTFFAVAVGGAALLVLLELAVSLRAWRAVRRQAK